MRERPILFSSPMVRAMLDGRKTQTRRALKPQPLNIVPFIGANGLPTWQFGACSHHHGVIDRHVKCPYGQPGDRLWVRERFSYSLGTGLADRAACWYWADGQPIDDDWSLPKPSIHMPRWASRITLEVTGVRVERLQEISYDDCIAEGIKQRWTCTNPGAGSYAHDTEVDADYRRLWNEINGAGSWEANPWVWVVEFKRIEQEQEE